jgi:HEAT repeat protein
MIELLGIVGGPRSLEAVSAAAEGADEELQDAATAALGKWMSPDAAPELLQLAKTLNSGKLKTRALRGYLRVAQQMGLPPQKKLTMCEEALKVAQRDEERRLILAVLGGIPSPQAMAMITPHLADPALAENAAAAALAIGEKIVKTEPQAVADAMRQIIKSGATREKITRAKALLKRGG